MRPTASRREFIGVLAAAAVPGSLSAFAQGSVLPVNTPGLDHLDVIVPDVEKSARFYMGLFRTTLHAQPFQGGQRYFVLLGPLPANRTVGYLAIGDARGRGTYIGHFCTSVADWRRDSAAVFAQLKEKVSAARFGEFNAGGGMIGRRGGWRMIRWEWTLQRRLMAAGTIGPVLFVRNLVVRSAFRLIPGPLLARVYALLFRARRRPEVPA